MIRALVVFVAFSVSLIAVPHVSGLVGEAWGVKPPSTDSRDQAEVGHEKEKKAKGKEIKKSGCPYGKDKNTGKCYTPRQGQFYEDSKGDVHVKDIDCVNLPWKPCGGSKKAVDTKTKASSEKKKK